MEILKINLGVDSDFDKAVHGDGTKKPLQQASSITVSTKDRALVSGRAGAVISFDVVMPDGSIRPVQATTTMANMLSLGYALRGRYGQGGPCDQTDL